MAKKLQNFERVQVVELDKAWATHSSVRDRRRLLVVRLAVKKGLHAGRIVALTGASRATVFRYLDKFRSGGTPELLRRSHRGGKRPMLTGPDYAAFVARLSHEGFCGAKEAQAWIAAHTKRAIALSSTYNLIRKIRTGLRTGKGA